VALTLLDPQEFEKLPVGVRNPSLHPAYTTRKKPIDIKSNADLSEKTG